MPSTTAKGVPFPLGSDTADTLDTTIQSLAEWVDARPGVSALTTVQRDALAAVDKWDGRIIQNQTTGRLERWSTGAAMWISATEKAQDIETMVLRPPAASVGVQVRLTAGATGSPFEVRNSADVVIAQVQSTGHVGGRSAALVNTAPGITSLAVDAAVAQTANNVFVRNNAQQSLFAVGPNGGATAWSHDPATFALQAEGAGLGWAAGNTSLLSNMSATVSNGLALRTRVRRAAVGTDWNTAVVDILRVTDSTEQQRITFLGTDGGVEYASHNGGAHTFYNAQGPWTANFDHGVRMLRQTTYQGRSDVGVQIGNGSLFVDRNVSNALALVGSADPAAAALYLGVTKDANNNINGGNPRIVGNAVNDTINLVALHPSSQTVGGAGSFIHSLYNSGSSRLGGFRDAGGGMQLDLLAGSTSVTNPPSGGALYAANGTLRWRRFDGSDFAIVG